MATLTNLVGVLLVTTIPFIERPVGESYAISNVSIEGYLRSLWSQPSPNAVFPGFSTCGSPESDPFAGSSGRTLSSMENIIQYLAPAKMESATRSAKHYGW